MRNRPRPRPRQRRFALHSQREGFDKDMSLATPVDVMEDQVIGRWGGWIGDED